MHEGQYNYGPRNSEFLQSENVNRCPAIFFRQETIQGYFHPFSPVQFKSIPGRGNRRALAHTLKSEYLVDLSEHLQEYIYKIVIGKKKKKTSYCYCGSNRRRIRTHQSDREESILLWLTICLPSPDIQNQASKYLSIPIHSIQPAHCQNQPPLSACWKLLSQHQLLPLLLSYHSTATTFL